MRPSMRAFRVVALAASLLVFTGIATAEKKVKQPSHEKAPKAATQAKAEHYAYLGVGVEELHPALVSHLPKQLTNGQGVLVGEVASGSPAEKAGLRTNDILMTYGDQKLFSPEQLAKLVRADSPGHEATLGIIREGKPEKVTVTLGERTAELAGSEPQWRPDRLARLPWPSSAGIWPSWGRTCPFLWGAAANCPFRIETGMLFAMLIFRPSRPNGLPKVGAASGNPRRSGSSQLPNTSNLGEPHEPC